MKYKFYLILIILSLSAFTYFFYSHSDSFVELIFFDVGQGDASLIILPDGKKILVDGGPDNKVLLGLGKYLNYFDRNIDLVILSHEHDDHVFGLAQVVERYKIGKIIHTAAACQTGVCQQMFKTISELEIESEELSNSRRIIFSANCVLDLYPPGNLQAKNINNRSIALRLDCVGAKIFMVGDGETEREEELLSSNENLSATVFKASHHGSKTSNGEDLLKNINPSLVIIPVGVENSFKHPAESTLARFESMGIKYFRTDINGNISLKFMGKTYPQVTIDKE